MFRILLITLFFITACSPDTVLQSLFCLDDKTENSTLPLSAVFPRSRFVKLQTTDNSLIGRQIGKIKKYNGKYYLANDFARLVIFDANGNFIQSIDKRGGGPGEYSILSDYDITAEGDIVILDLKQLIIYDSNAKLKKVINLPVTGFNIKIVNDKYLLCASGEDYSVYLVDKDGKILEKHLETNNLPTVGKQSPFIAFGNDSILFQSEYSNTFLCFDVKNEKFTEINLCCGNSFINKKDEDNLKNIHGNSYLDNISSKNIIGGASSCNGYLLFVAGNSKTGFKSYLADITTRQIKHVITQTNIDDISFTGIHSILRHLGKSDASDCFISYMEMNQLINGLKTSPNNADPSSPVKIFEGIANPEDENPVLIELGFEQ